MSVALGIGAFFFVSSLSSSDESNHIGESISLFRCSSTLVSSGRMDASSRWSVYPSFRASAVVNGKERCSCSSPSHIFLSQCEAEWVWMDRWKEGPGQGKGSRQLGFEHGQSKGKGPIPAHPIPDQLFFFLFFFLFLILFLIQPCISWSLWILPWDRFIFRSILCGHVPAHEMRLSSQGWMLH